MNSPTQFRILSAVWRTPGLARSDLRDIVGLHVNTVTRMVAALLRKGYLREGGAPQRGRQGRPRIPLEVDPTRMCVGGIAIGAGAVESVVLNLLGEPLGDVARLEATGAVRVARATSGLLRGVLRRRPLALGISVTGFVDPVSPRILFSSATPGEEMDLAPLLRRARGTPVVLNSEVHALSTRWLMGHRAAEHDDTLVVTLEDGAVGASLLVEGHPNKGCVLGGNELGHMTLGVTTAPCYCGGNGCVERVFSSDFLHRCGGSGTLAGAFAASPIPAAAQRIVDLAAAGLANATVFARPRRLVVAGTPGTSAVFREALERAWRRWLPEVFRDRVVLEWYGTKATVSAETAGWLAISRIVREGGAGTPSIP